jgi:DNA-binding NarL/FixJ family response regulator
MKAKKNDPGEFRFTPRETEVARLIARGSPRKIVADELKITTRTIDAHLFRLRAKTGTGSIFELRNRLFPFFYNVAK